MIRDTLRVLGSNIAVNLSSFLALALAGRVMPVEQFATLSLIVSMSQLGSSALDLGTNVGTVKKYAEKKERRFLSTLIWLKAAVYTLCLALVIFGYLSGVPAFWLIVIACAASIDLWSGARAFDQARMDFASFAQANVLFAILRIPLAVLGIVTGNAFAVAAALYIGPLVAIVSYKWRKTAEFVDRFDRSTASEVLRYAMPVYISATLYTCAIYLPQFVISHRLDAAAVATFGVLLIFVGPLVLLNASVRIHLLPLFAGNAIRRADVIANKRVLTLIFGGTAMALAGLAVASVMIERIYGVKYPGIGLPFAIFIGLNFLCLLLGEFNLEVHRLGRIKVEAWVNAGRLAALAIVLWLFGNDLLSIVILSSLTMLVGEIVLFLIIGELARREAAEATPQVVGERAS